MEEFFGRLNEFHKKYSRFLLMALLIIAVAVMFRVLPYLLALMMPFVIGWIISLAAYPLVKMLKKRLKIPYKVGAVITVLLLLTVLTLLIAFIVGAVSDFSGDIINNWDDLYSSFTDYLKNGFAALERFSDSLPFDFVELINKNLDGISIEKNGNFEISKEITKWLTPFAGSLAGGTISVVKSLPEVLVFAVMLILSTYFFTGDKEKMRAWYEKKASANFKEKMLLIKKECFGAFFGWLRAQFILSGITAAELFVGFLIMGVKHAFLIAVITAFIDMLPVFGTGTVLIPWAIINLLTGGTVYFSVGMIVIYIVCLSVRNLLQPKILSSNIGLDPLATLVSIWIGYKLWGFLGMIVVPVGAMLVYKLYRIGIFDWFFVNHKEET